MSAVKIGVYPTPSALWRKLILARWAQASAPASKERKALGLQEATVRTHEGKGSIKRDPLSAAAASLGLNGRLDVTLSIRHSPSLQRMNLLEKSKNKPLTWEGDRRERNHVEKLRGR